MNLNEVRAVPYEADFAEWLGEQIAVFRRGEFEKLDRDNLLEELEELLANHQSELMHRLEVLMHLLECQFQPQRKGPSWMSTLFTQRARIARLFKQSPSLRRLVEEYAKAEYRAAVKHASIQTGLPKSTFPETLPYSVEQLLDEDFVP